MISFDLIRLATDRSATEEVARFLSQAFGNFSVFPASQFIIKMDQATPFQPVPGTEAYYFYPYTDPVMASVNDRSKFFYGDCLISMQFETFEAATTGWIVEIFAKSPSYTGALPNIPLYRIDNLTNPDVQEGTVVSFEMPKFAFTEISVAVTTLGVLDAVGLRTNIFWNGFSYVNK